MRVSVFSHYFTPEIGAPSARFQDMARQWLAGGHEVQVVTCFPNHPTGTVYPGYRAGRYQCELRDGIRIHRHWTYITANKGFVRKSLGHLSYYPAACWLSLRRMARPEVAIGTSPTFFAAMAALKAGRQFNVPFVMDVRDLWPAAFVELGVLRNRTLIHWLERWELSLYRRANRVVTVTEAFRANLIGRGVPAAKVVTIPNGADVEYWQPADAAQQIRRDLGLHGRFVVLYIGAHGVSQALSRVLECAGKLRAHPGVAFVFVGEGAEKDSLVAQARTMGLPSVQFHDPVDKAAVKRFYSAADLCLVPLKNIEIFSTFIPSKMFEMMAMAKPIVASVRGEAADILRRSQGAVVVDPEDSSALAAAIVALKAAPHEGQAMGRRGREFVVAHYSREALASRYLGVLGDAIAQCRSRASFS